MVPCFRYTLPAKSISMRLFSRKRKISTGARCTGGSVLAGLVGTGGVVSSGARRAPRCPRPEGGVVRVGGLRVLLVRTEEGGLVEARPTAPEGCGRPQARHGSGWPRLGIRR